MRRNQDLISVRYFWDKSGGILYSLEAFSFLFVYFKFAETVVKRIIFPCSCSWSWSLSAVTSPEFPASVKTVML